MKSMVSVAHALPFPASLPLLSSFSRGYYILRSVALYCVGRGTFIKGQLGKGRRRREAPFLLSLVGMLFIKSPTEGKGKQVDGGSGHTNGK